MNDAKAKKVVEEILNIEKEAIGKRMGMEDKNVPIYGKNKVDIDVVNKILNILEKENDGNEN